MKNNAVSRLALGALLATSLGGCLDTGDLDPSEDIESSAFALSAPTVLELVNTCDQQNVKLYSSGNNTFVLDPGNGSERYKGTLSPTKGACSVGVKFNVPANYKAVVGIATTYGTWSTAGSTTGGTIQDQAGFTENRRPLTVYDTQFGPSEIDDKFVPKASSGTVDLQVDGNNAADDRLLVTGCGAQNTWFYVRPSLKDASKTTVNLSLILGSFRLIPCSQAYPW
jgi:hypothetical protein